MDTCQVNYISYGKLLLLVFIFIYAFKQDNNGTWSKFDLRRKDTGDYSLGTNDTEAKICLLTFRMCRFTQYPLLIFPPPVPFRLEHVGRIPFCLEWAMGDHSVHSSMHRSHLHQSVLMESSYTPAMPCDVSVQTIGSWRHKIAHLSKSCGGHC